jgi:hypothetical protein
MPGCPSLSLPNVDYSFAIIARTRQRIKSAPKGNILLSLIHPETLIEGVPPCGRAKYAFSALWRMNGNDSNPDR